MRIRCAAGGFSVRRFRLEDTAGLYAILSDPTVMRWIEPPYSTEQAVDLLQGKGLVSSPAIYALADERDRIVGQIIFHSYDADSYELGWIIARSHWGCGLAAAVTEALIQHCRELGVKECVIECVPEQTASAHIAAKCGFTCIGQTDGLLTFRRKV